MLRISTFTIITALIVGIQSPAHAAFILPQAFEFNSHYGVNVKAKLTNLDSNRIDLIPGQAGLLEVSAEAVDPLGVNWPLSLEDSSGNFQSNRNRRIFDHGFKGFLINATITCKDDEDYFSGVNEHIATADLKWDEVNSYGAIEIKFPKECSQLELTFEVTPSILEINLEGSSSASESAELPDWQDVSDLSERNVIGSLGKHLNYLRWRPIKNATLGMKKVQFTATSRGGKVSITSITRNVCSIRGQWVLLTKTGKCSLGMSVTGDKNYDSVPRTSYSFIIKK